MSSDNGSLPEHVTAGSGGHGIAPTWAVALLLFVGSLCIFWPLLIGMELLGRPSGSTSPSTVEMQFLDREHPSQPNGVVLSRDAVPSFSWSDPNPPEAAERVVYRHTFDAISPGEDMALYMGWVRRILEIEVNGTVLRQQTVFDRWGVLGGFEATAFVIPAEILKPTGNTLEIIGEGRSKKVAPAFYVSTPDDVLSAASWGRLFDVELPIAAVFVMMVVLLIILSARWPNEDRYRMSGLALLLVAWILKNLAHLNLLPAIPDSWRMFGTFLTIFVFLAALAVFLLRWTGSSPRYSRFVGHGLAGFVSFLALMNIVADPLLFFRMAFWTETALTAIICVSGAILLSRRTAQRAPSDGIFGILETLMFLVALWVICFDALDDQFDIMLPVFDGLAFVNYKTPAFGILLGVGLCATLAAQAAATRNALRDANIDLTRQVQAQAQALEATYRKAAIFERRNATIEERQRIIRDMHDGVGSLLLGLSVQIEQGKLSLEEVRLGIRRGITDLRLMATAMDSVGDDLSIAMEAFVDRVRPDLEAQGIVLNSSIELQSSDPPLPPRTILNIYRILQEAISNALRHSGATEVWFHALGNPDSLSFSIRDNGTGFDRSSGRSGRGLANMRRRAQSIRAEINIESDTSGTQIILSIPIVEPGGPSPA